MINSLSKFKTSFSLYNRLFSGIVQSGILPEGSTNAYFGVFNVNNNDLNQMKKSIKQYHPIIEKVSKQYDTQLYGTISFGKSLWTKLTSGNKKLENTGKELIDFPQYGIAPSTQCDLYIHIHGKNQNAIFDSSREIIEEFGESIKLFDERDGFKWRDSRDLTGFIDGTANPHTLEKRKSAGLNDDGSSYVMIQRYIHNLNKWNKVEEKEQEEIIGRTKKDSKELKNGIKTSHVSRTDLKENGIGLKIVRHSLPYGSSSGDKGLWFTAYCHTIYNLDTILKSMFGLKDEIKDRLANEFISAVSGSYFFVPSIDMINNL